MCPFCRFLLFLLQNGFQYVAGLGNLGQVNFRPGRTFGARSRCSGLPALQVGTHTLGLIFFKRTGVRLLLCNADRLENVEDGPALDFQLTC